MGLLACLLNPKVAILYISLLPQFVDPERGHVALQGLLLGLTQIAVGVAGNAFFIVTAGSVAGFLRPAPALAAPAPVCDGHRAGGLRRQDRHRTNGRGGRPALTADRAIPTKRPSNWPAA
ncbi:hypothetical protein [Streptomyces decoyicus]